MKFAYPGYTAIDDIPNPYDRMIAVLQAQIELLKLGRKGTIRYSGHSTESINDDKEVEIKNREELIDFLFNQADPTAHGK